MYKQTWSWRIHYFPYDKSNWKCGDFLAHISCHILMDFHWEQKIGMLLWYFCGAFLSFILYFFLFLLILSEKPAHKYLCFVILFNSARSKALKILALFQQKKHLVHALLYIHFHASIICSFSSILQLYYCIITVWLVLFHDCDSFFEIKGTNFSLL